MKRLFATLLVTLLAGLPVSALAAAGERHPTATVSTPFQLRVDGPVGRGATFWVAYGPLAGTWGIKQLQAAGPGYYAGRLRLPRGRTMFSFIQGKGVVYTRLGAVPGNPVTTIRHVGPVLVGAGAVPTVVWHVPIG